MGLLTRRLRSLKCGFPNRRTTPHQLLHRTLCGSSHGLCLESECFRDILFELNLTLKFSYSLIVAGEKQAKRHRNRKQTDRDVLRNSIGLSHHLPIESN